MKYARLTAALAVSAVLSACAYIPSQEGEPQRVSPDYTATGTADVRAYAQGKNTVLEFDGAPMFVSIRDENGETVDYEKIGKYFRINRRLDNFTVWVNGRSTTFTAIMTTRVFSATKPQPAAATEPVKLAVMEVKETANDNALRELLKTAEKQLADARNILEKCGKNPNATGAELFAVSQRLDEIEARLTTASAAMVSVTFPTTGTSFKPSKEVAKRLIESAKAADRINIEGHTDSRVAGAMDAKIAAGRANAARKFLVANGVQPEKIKVSSMAQGGFVAPNITKEGRALNRRVDIEIVNARIAELRSTAVQIAALQAPQ